MSDALLEVTKSPMARLLGALASALGLALGLAASGLWWVSDARADLDGVLTVTADHERRVKLLEQARINDSWNLYLVCESAGRADCRKPDKE